jgi:hypothetical protein
MTVPISEVVDISTSMQARFADLFETLGGWVTSTDDPALQRRFAQAAHRHAWHAQLWSDRRPTIPLEPATPTRVDAATEDATPALRLAWYLDQIDRLRADLIALSGRIDSQLDPSTTRVISLILADLAGELD